MLPDEERLGDYQTSRERMERLNMLMQPSPYKPSILDNPPPEQFGPPAPRYNPQTDQYAGSRIRPMPGQNLSSPVAQQEFARERTAQQGLGGGSLGDLFKPYVPQQTFENLPLSANIPGTSLGIGPGAIARPWGLNQLGIGPRRNPTLGSVPVVGPEAARTASGMTSPFALGVTAATLGTAGLGEAGAAGVAPAARALGYSLAGQTILGSAGAGAEKAGVPTLGSAPLIGEVGPRSTGELAGGFFGGETGIIKNLKSGLTEDARARDRVLKDIAQGNESTTANAPVRSQVEQELAANKITADQVLAHNRAGDVVGAAQANIPQTPQSLAQQAAEKIRNYAAENPLNPGAVTSRTFRAGAKTLLTPEETAALWKASANDPTAQAAISRFTDVGRIENEQDLIRGLRAGDAVSPTTPPTTLTPPTPEQPPLPGMLTEPTGSQQSLGENVPQLPTQTAPPVPLTAGEEMAQKLQGVSREVRQEAPGYTPPNVPSSENAIQPGALPSKEIINQYNLTSEQAQAVAEAHSTASAATPLDTTRAQGIIGKALSGQKINPFEREQVRKAYGDATADSLKPEGPGIIGEIGGALNLPRAILASTDLSATLRQGYILSLSHPELAARAFKAQLKAFSSVQGAEAIEKELAMRPTYNLAKDTAGVFLPSWHGGAFGAQEEAFQLGKSFAQKLVEKPLNILGVDVNLLGRSERAYVTYLNKLRMDFFDKTIADWQDAAKNGATDYANDPGALKALGTYINHATGRGGLGPLTSWGPALNVGFFSPRLTLSRFQVFGDLRHPAIRGLVAQDLAKSYGTGMSALALLGATGVAKVQVDPRSSDFGKAQFGNTRVEFFGGATPMIRLAAMMAPLATGQSPMTLTQAGEVMKTDPFQVVKQFLRQKMSPTAGTAYDIAVGRDIQGNEMRSPSSLLNNAVLQNIVPLVIQDFVSALKNEGPTGAAISTTGLVGMGITTYPPTAQTQFMQRFKEKNPDVPTTDRSAVNLIASQDPELKGLLDQSRKQGLESGSNTAQEMATNQAIYQQAEKDNHLPELAQSVQSGGPNAGPEFIKAYDKYQQHIVDHVKDQFFGQDPNQAKTPIGQAIQSYRDVSPTFDPLTNTYDFKTYFEQKDAAMAALEKLSPSAAMAIKTQLKTFDPNVRAVEAQLKTARPLYHQVLDTSQWKAKVPNQDVILKLQQQAQFVERAMQARGIQNPTPAMVYGMIQKANPNIDSKTIGWAFQLRPGSQMDKLLANPARTQLLKDNYDILYKFFPTIYRDKQLLAQIGRQKGLTNKPLNLSQYALTAQ